MRPVAGRAARSGLDESRNGCKNLRSFVCAQAAGEAYSIDSAELSMICGLVEYASGWVTTLLYRGGRVVITYLHLCMMVGGIWCFRPYLYVPKLAAGLDLFPS